MMIFTVFILILALNASLAHALNFSATRNDTEIEEISVCCSEYYSNIISEFISKMVNFSLKSTRTAIAIIGENVKGLVLNILSIMGAAMRTVLMAFLSALGTGLKTATIFLLDGLGAVIECAFLIAMAVIGTVIKLLIRALIIIIVATCDAITTAMIYAAGMLLEIIVMSIITAWKHSAITVILSGLLQLCLMLGKEDPSVTKKQKPTRSKIEPEDAMRLVEMIKYWRQTPPTVVYFHYD